MRTNAEHNSKRSSPVVVFFDGDEERQAAVTFCGRLVDRFWAQCDFEVDWWPFAKLEESRSATEARNQALEAELVIFAPGTRNEIAHSTRNWIEDWLRSRPGNREGLIICLLPQANERWSEETQHYLRDVARRAGMDFLTDIPETVDQPMPDSLDSYSQRAQCMTGVLDEILHKPGRPMAVNR